MMGIQLGSQLRLQALTGASSTCYQISLGVHIQIAWEEHRKASVFPVLVGLRRPKPMQARIAALSSCAEQLRLQSLEPATW